MQLRASTCVERCADYDHSVLLADFYTEENGHPRTFDLDLTIEAVNAYDRLRAIEAAVAGIVTSPSVYHDAGAIHAALREALDGPA